VNIARISYWKQTDERCQAFPTTAGPFASQVAGITLVFLMLATVASPAIHE
jgi:hypothetical protein